MPLLFSLLCTQRNGVGELIYTHEESDPGVAVRLHGARKQKEFFFILLKLQAKKGDGAFRLFCRV